MLENLSIAVKSRSSKRRSEDSQGRLPLEVRDRELLIKKASELDERYLQKPELSENDLIQEVMAYMRKVRDKKKYDINITYPIAPPFAFVNIIFNKAEGEFNYIVKEPRLKDGEKGTIALLRSKLEATMDNEEVPVIEGEIFTESKVLREYLKTRYEDIIDLYDVDIEERRKPVLLYYLERELLGLGRSDPVLKDPFIEDISCNGPHIPIYIFHRIFGSMKTNVAYESDVELNRYVIKLAQISGKHVSIYAPILDATLLDGSRINLTLGSEVTKKGSTFTIRKFSKDPISPIDLIRFSSVSHLQMAYFWTIIESKKSLLVSGGTASGKTTLLNAICMFIRPEDKIVSIEDTPEIHIDHPNWIQSVSRQGYGAGASGTSVSGVGGGGGGRPGDVTLFDLLVAGLRQRPEYVIVGEVRGKEAFTLFQAISVGHASMSTIHAGTIDELLHRVENEPMNIPRVLFQSLDCVAFQGQVVVGNRRMRRIKSIVEILDVEKDTKNLLTHDVFVWDPKSDKMVFSGRSFLLETIARASGKTADALLEDMKRKEQYLKLMDKKGISNYEQVSKAINDYYVNPAAAIMELDGA
ncbi:type II/IV secretion system ATPase subunit [Methanomassiliicoccus luminyensis]|uniref:type II/IV secretion system ATPase subunit n=1 Tax=Methanomassiliicoccus luminyensis TaxID=1080712 RepID=UPI000370556D|nr:type II/IV secretion system ATPase subunit [Methanomassiliicoccus luminyensis]